MSEWGVYLVIVSLIGTAIAIGAPVIKLNTSITRLIVRLEHLGEGLSDLNNDMDAFEKSNHESHKRLWDKNDEQDKILADHESRLKLMEREE